MAPNIPDRIEKKIVLRAPRQRVWRALSNAEELRRQKTYMGKRGKSTSTIRSDHFRLCRYVGVKHS